MSHASRCWRGRRWCRVRRGIPRIKTLQYIAQEQSSPAVNHTTTPRRPQTGTCATNAAALPTDTGTLPPPEQDDRGNLTASYSKDHRVANGMGTTRRKPAVWKHITGATPNATLHAGSLTTWMPSAEQAGQMPPHCLSLTANNPTANVRRAAPPSITPPTPPSVAYDALRAPPKIGLPPAAKTPPASTKTGPTPRPSTSTMASGVEKVQVQGSGKAKRIAAPSPKAKPYTVQHTSTK